MPLITETDNLSNSHKSNSLDGISYEFIPYISFNEKNYKNKSSKNENDTILVSEDEKVILGNYFKEEFKSKNLKVISVLGEVVEEKSEDGKSVKLDKLYMSFDVLDGTGENYDSDGTLDIVITGNDANKVTVTEPKELPMPVEFSDDFLIELTVDVTEQKKEMTFYVDFKATDNGGDYFDGDIEGDLKNLFCGRVKVEYTNIEIKSKIYFYSITNGEFLGELDSEFEKNRTIIITDEEWDDLKLLDKLSLKSEKTKIKSTIQFDWTKVNKGGLPSLGELIHKYPTNEGGSKTSPSIDSYAFNQCAIRLSYGLIKSKFNISSYPRVNVTSEGYARSSKGLADWLYNNAFRPQGVGKDISYFNKNTAHGIIFLWDKSEGGISHIDVIYEGQTGSGYYGADEIWYWELN